MRGRAEVRDVTSRDLVAISLVVDGGVTALHRIASVLAHQRVSIHALHSAKRCDEPAHDVTVHVYSSATAANQLLERLRRVLPVREASIRPDERVQGSCAPRSSGAAARALHNAGQVVSASLGNPTRGETPPNDA